MSHQFQTRNYTMVAALSSEIDRQRSSHCITSSNDERNDDSFFLINFYIIFAIIGLETIIYTSSIMAILALSPWRATVLKTRQYPPSRSAYRSGAASNREWTSCLSYIQPSAWRLACKSPRFPSPIMWSTCFRTARARTRVVLIRPCRIVSVVSALRRAFLWSAGFPSFLNPLRWEIILSWVLEASCGRQTGRPVNDPLGAMGKIRKRLKETKGSEANSLDVGQNRMIDQGVAYRFIPQRQLSVNR